MLCILADCSLYSKSLHFAMKCHIILLCKEIIANWILHITGRNFQKRMSAYKFQVFITLNINSPSLPPVLKDTTEINMLYFIDKDIFNLIQNNLYWVSNVNFVSYKYTHTFQQEYSNASLYQLLYLKILEGLSMSQSLVDQKNLILKLFYIGMIY